MDPALQELLSPNLNAEDSIALICRLKDAQQLPERFNVVSQFGDIVTGRALRKDITMIYEAEEKFSLKASRQVEIAPPPKVESPDMESEDTSEESQIMEKRNTRQFPASGKGVIVAAIDFGIDFAHPNFLKPDGSSRLLAIWDQSNREASNLPKYGYGKLHTQAEINIALASEAPYETLSYHPGTSDYLNIGAHGTHVLDIAAGSGMVGAPGIAPESDLIFVHLSSRGTSGTKNLGDSLNILEAIHFIKEMAGDRPLAINLSAGRHGGPHDGTTLVEQAMDNFLAERSDTMICQSAGNYHQSKTHHSGQVRPGRPSAFSFNIHQADKTANELEIWYPGKDQFTIELINASAIIELQATLGEVVEVALGGTTVGRLYHRIHEPNSRKNHIDLFLYPNAPKGNWQVKLIGSKVVDGRYNAWLERDRSGVHQSRFAPSDVNRKTTIGTICNGYNTIAVGAWNAQAPLFNMAPFSSEGPTTDGRLKPDLAAPGVRILAARSSSRNVQRPGRALTRMSGTSMATPHVTGACALLLEHLPKGTPFYKIRELILKNTDQLTEHNMEKYRVGNGLLNFEKALQSLSISKPLNMKEYSPTDERQPCNCHETHEHFSASDDYETIADAVVSEETNPPAPDSALVARFVAAHQGRWCVPGARGSRTCSPVGNPRTIDMVVIHTLGVPNSSRRSAVDAIISGWSRHARRQASAHYIIGRNGHITQMVKEENIAFHVGRVINRRSIGIEHADVCNSPLPYTTQLYESSAALVRDIAGRNNFTPNRTSVVAHSAVGNHGDPGPYWDWDYYYALLQWNGTNTTGKPTRTIAKAADITTVPNGWRRMRRRDIRNSHCANRRDPYGATWLRIRANRSSAQALDFQFTINQSGCYSLAMWWPRSGEACASVNIEITKSGSTETIQLNQRRRYGRWNMLGNPFTFRNTAGQPMQISVSIKTNSTASGFILADSIRLLKQSLHCTPPVPSAEDESWQEDIASRVVCPLEASIIADLEEEEWIEVTEEEMAQVNHQHYDSNSQSFIHPNTPLPKDPIYTNGAEASAPLEKLNQFQLREIWDQKQLPKALLNTWEPIALPGEHLTAELQPGDVLLRKLIGEGGMIIQQQLTDGNLISSLTGADSMEYESSRNGNFALLKNIETTTTSANTIARLISTTSGSLPENQMILRPKILSEDYQLMELDEGNENHRRTSRTDLEVKLRVFIPSQIVHIGLNNINDGFGGDNRGFSYSRGSSRAEIIMNFDFSRPSASNPLARASTFHWGQTTKYANAGIEHVPRRPDWYWRKKSPSIRPIARRRLLRTPGNLNGTARWVTPRLSLAGAKSLQVDLLVAGGNPLAPGSPDIDARVRIIFDQRSNGGAIYYSASGTHDGFPAYELYLNRRRVYVHDPVARGQSPYSLFGTGAGEFSFARRRTVLVRSAATAAARVGRQGSLSAAPQSLRNIISY